MATMPNTNINIPYSAFLDPTTGRPSQAWLLWLMSPSFININLGSALPVTSGGTGLTTIPTNGQLLIGNGTGYTLNTLGFGAGISVTNGSGTITVANTGVLSNLAGAGISVSNPTGNVTIGNTGVLSIIAGSGISASSPAGNVTVANTGVLSFSGGTTGLTPATATTGAVTLAGTLAIANGGTNGTATPTAYGVAYGTGTAYAFTAAGTAKQVLIANTSAAPTWSTLTSGTSILYGDNSGGFSNVTIGTGISFVAGTLSAAGSGGTVTSVGFTGGLITVATATTTPALTVAGTSGGIVYFSNASTWASSAALTQYGVVYGGGAGASPVATAAGTTGQVLTATTGGAPTWASPATSGTVTSVSVVSANGFAGTVATATTTPAITISTSVTGLLKGNGTAISAAVANTDYVPLSTVITKTADYTITGTDTWIINNKPSTALTLTFPAASSWTGRYITVKNMQALAVNSASSNIVPIDSTTAGTAILLGVVGNWATLVSDGTNWVIMQAASNNNLLLE